MKAKPVSPALHGGLDYALSTLQAVLPPLLGLNAYASRTYQGISLPYLVLNAFTNTPAGIKRKVPFKMHKKADAGYLIGQAALTFAPFIRKNRKVLLFHLAFLGLAVANYMLTDYKETR